MAAEAPWSAERMRELATRHARVEARGRLDELMETLVAEPVYEFVVQGLALRGGAKVRRYYRQFFENYLPRAVGGERVGQWGDERAVAREDRIEFAGPDGPETHRIFSVLWAEGRRLGGERIYTSDLVVRRMTGPMFPELEPILP